VVEDLESEVRHPDLVEIREAEQAPDLGLGRILMRGVEEASRVPARLGHERQVRFIQQTQLVHELSSVGGATGANLE
jgi:hypothetical protein